MDKKDKKPFRPYPDTPDLERVTRLRARLHEDKGASASKPRVSDRVARSARDLGTYTLIPSLMVAGPVVGYFLGRAVEKWLGGEPWGAVGGMLLGVVAAFREVILLLKRRAEK